MNRFGILGHPLGHTMSPAIHARLFALSGGAGEYTVLDVPPEQLEARRAELLALDGFNVTIPYKTRLLPWMDALDATAQRYGAMNVAARGADGRWTGYNTDCHGFLKAVEVLGAQLATGRRVCVLGAGGAGRMFAIEAARSGAAVVLAVRESGRERARAVCADIAALCPDAATEVVDIAALGAGFTSHLLINATPVGMHPHCDATPVAAAALAGCAYVFDCIYNPQETLLLREARAAGCRVAGGMAMLVWQAVKAHEIWRGARFAADDVEAIIAAAGALMQI